MFRVKHRVSVILATIDEEYVFRQIRDIRRLFGKGTEIIVVDKSGDAYYRRLVRTGAKVIRQKSRGVDKAIMLGLKAARGDILVHIDADGTHDASGMVKGVRMVESGKADFVLGNRMADLQEGSMGGYLQFGNSVLNAIFNALYGTRLHDVLVGLFVMRKEDFEAIKDIEPYGTGIAFFAAELSKRGRRIGEVDIRYYPRTSGESKLAKSKFMWGLNTAYQFLIHRF